jgi:hypothetical protein
MTTKGSVSAVCEGHGTTEQIDIDGYWGGVEDVLGQQREKAAWTALEGGICL